MNFSVKPAISDCGSLKSFFERWNVGPDDLIVSNEYILSPKNEDDMPPCDILYQEHYGAGEPSDEMVDAMMEDLRGRRYRRIIAVGGGTVIDIAKLFVFDNRLSCGEIFEKGHKLTKRRNMIAVPTTCGTGSEVTGISIVEFKKKGTKLGLALPSLFPDEAVLIPDTLKTLPYDVFAASSIDALIHAMESHVSPKAGPFSKAMGKGAILQILTGYREMLESKPPGTLPDRLDIFLTASTMAGIAFANAGVGAVHALSYPIGGNYHVPHGQSNYLVFPEVFEAYERHGADLAELEDILAEALNCEASQTWPSLFSVLDGVLKRGSLQQLSVGEKECREMAASVVQNQQRLLANNPIPLTEKQIEDIYLRCQ